MQVDKLPKVRHILRSLVSDARNVILKDQQSGDSVAAGRYFLNINDGAIGDSSNLVQPLTALPLDIFGGFRLAAKQQIGSSQRGGTAYDLDVKPQ